MHELQIFNNAEFGQVRTVQLNNETYFVGKDVCEAFGDTNYRRSLANIDETDKGVSQINTPGGMQNMTLINESGLYSLLFQMQPQKAKGVSQNDDLIKERIEKLHRFKRWVTSEVLPAIRKHGVYAVDELLNDPELAIKAFTALKEEREKNKLLQEENASMKPKALFADAVSASDSSILIRDLAKLLRQNGVEIGEKRLFKWLREQGYICKGSTMPTQRAMEMELFEIIVRTVEKGNGLPLETKTAKVTGKGQIYFINKFLSKTSS